MRALPRTVGCGVILGDGSRCILYRTAARRGPPVRLLEYFIPSALARPVSGVPPTVFYVVAEEESPRSTARGPRESRSSANRYPLPDSHIPDGKTKISDNLVRLQRHRGQHPPALVGQLAQYGGSIILPRPRAVVTHAGSQHPLIHLPDQQK